MFVYGYLSGGMLLHGIHPSWTHTALNAGLLLVAVTHNYWTGTGHERHETVWRH